MTFLATHSPVLGFIALGLISRLMPHLPNLTALNAIALFGAYSQKNIATSLFALLIILLISDAVIGFHAQMPFVYGALVLVVGMGRLIRLPMIWKQLPLWVISSSMVFFLVTNFGVWLSCDFYAKSIEGLALCYARGLPFLSTQILGDLMYSFAMFGALALFKAVAKKSLLPASIKESPSVLP